ncbi:MAG: prephenate dehydratase [Armatimonadetes bacterium]|nr:prephenate dehydratase [Armatimonadota bacterium]MBS1710509.1 prephenate dehydratase [Armatimonadota bacterium]MBX3108180.1 prephenate dehydratase [Fimbriimonadaceae bacterium]
MESRDKDGRTLADVRIEIDTVDAELIRLLERRIDLTREVGTIKGRDNSPFFTPERERQMYERLRNSKYRNLTGDQLVAIFREVISAGRAAEKPLHVAYWGPEGTYTHQAAAAAFGHSVSLVPVYNIREVFQSVERSQADYGVVPIENSVAGVVPETLDMFPKSNVKIVSETFLDIHHHLGSVAGSLEEVKRVYAGPQPAAQCREWLRDHLPHADIVDIVPTAEAAKRALADPQGAAIVNEVSLSLYGLTALAEHIQDHASNRTRFVVLGYNEPAASGHDKTSLMFKLKNRRGELYRVLGCFVENEVNLTMIESRPDPRDTFQYMFYMDMDGHRTDQNVMRAVNDLRSVAIETVILGSYPSYDPGVQTL